MPVSAYILVEVEPGKIKEVMSKLGGIKGIKSACCVTGPFDLILSVETENIEQLGDMVTNSLQALNGVHKTITSLCTMCMPFRD
jgi:DNA-binding Lrp family transcriptional regulator